MEDGGKCLFWTVNQWLQVNYLVFNTVETVVIILFQAINCVKIILDTHIV